MVMQRDAVQQRMEDIMAYTTFSILGIVFGMTMYLLGWIDPWASPIAVTAALGFVLTILYQCVNLVRYLIAPTTSNTSPDPAAD